ncbi:threonine ammonia-lyase [Actinosynnema pretiosum]|uniref:threonine ammonia-lyase n=1 Tax=Actinosynnema pretiosum TaxID=42197 RepID=UPI001E49F9E3|nr:pyridoxal-phosphate dependent enzyme [Actinosynnema pretiosum]
MNRLAAWSVRAGTAGTAGTAGARDRATPPELPDRAEPAERAIPPRLATTPGQTTALSQVSALGQVTALGQVSAPGQTTAQGQSAPPGRATALGAATTSGRLAPLGHADVPPTPPSPATTSPSRATTSPTRADVLAAALRLEGHVLRTPLLALESLPGVLLKAEHAQRAGSFKIRGAANALLAAPCAEVVTGSSGNHGLAVATLGRSLGIRVTVVMAAGASAAKADALRRLGATVLAVPGGVDERDARARELAARTGARLVPSSDDALVVAGQGTVGLEVFEDAPGVDTVFVPVGGGGLLAGVCLAARDLPVRVVGVEPADARRYARSLAEGAPVVVPPSRSVADGLRGQRPGAVTLPVITRRVDELVAVDDDAVERAAELLRRAGVRAEPSGAAALAGALTAGFTGTAAVVVSGGNTAEALAATGRRRTTGGRGAGSPRAGVRRIPTRRITPTELTTHLSPAHPSPTDLSTHPAGAVPGAPTRGVRS